MTNPFQGLTVVGLSVLAAWVAVIVWRRFRLGPPLEDDATFVTNTYPIVGLIYGVFLGFTIVITWGHFRDAETSTTQEVTRLSELWRDVEVLPDGFRTDVRCRLYRYAQEVVASDWDSMAVFGTHSPDATRAYEDIWGSFYSYDPSASLSQAQVTFYQEAVGQLNELGRERRRRGLFAATEVQPVVRAFLIWGGVLVVLFSLLIPARRLWVQLGVTAVVAGLIASSIVLALGLERPFAGDLSVDASAFARVVASFERRAEGNPCPVEIVGEGVVSTATNQTFPMEDPATGDLWFSSFEGSFDEQTIMVARRTDDGWATPEVAPFSGRWGDRAPRFSPDGSYMLITSNRPRPGSEETGDMDIWHLERTDDGWSEPELVPLPMSSPAVDIHPSVTGSAVWVASRREGGLGRSDLYRIGFDGAVTHPGPPLNDELSQSDVWVSPDETWMIVVITDHPDGYGGDDLYVSRRVGDTWSVPVNLGPEINTPEYEYGPSVSADGQYLLFTSHRDGPSHVYRVPLSRVRDVLGT